MRRGVILAVLGLGALALFAAKVLLPRPGLTSGPIPGPTAAVDRTRNLEASAPLASNVVSRSKLQRSSSPRSDAKAGSSAAGDRVDNSPPETQDQREARVAARVIELGDLSRRTDRASLETLLLEVRNPDAEIRQAALDAITQSGNRDAIPGLREAAAQTLDTAAKEAIDEVIEFMNLPTLTEVLRGQGATNSRRPAPVRP